MDDRREYDEPEQYEVVICPDCGLPLEYDTSYLHVGYVWWCSGCTSFRKENEL